MKCGWYFAATTRKVWRRNSENKDYSLYKYIHVHCLVYIGYNTFSSKLNSHLKPTSWITHLKHYSTNYFSRLNLYIFIPFCIFERKSSLFVFFKRCSLFLSSVWLHQYRKHWYIKRITLSVISQVKLHQRIILLVKLKIFMILSVLLITEWRKCQRRTVGFLQVQQMFLTDPAQ